LQIIPERYLQLVARAAAAELVEKVARVEAQLEQLEV
jgi:hypothetical protein